ncbi:unnamed protein product [Caretta caretta]
MAAGVGDRDPLLRLRRHLREEVEPQTLLLQPPPGGVAEESTNVEKKEKPLPRLNIHSAFWILASIAVTYYVDFFKTIKETIQADSWCFVLGSCLLVASLAIAFYCIIYLECSSLSQHCLMACMVISHPFVAVHSVYGCCDACVTAGMSHIRCQEICLCKEGEEGCMCCNAQKLLG